MALNLLPMKKIAPYFFLLLPFHAWCQFHEKFDDNRNQWFIENGDAYSRKIESAMAQQVRAKKMILKSIVR
jgi:hypothetical protein